MLLDILPQLLEHRIVLASGSVNRRNILANCGLIYEKGHFEASPSGFEENLDKNSFKSSRDYVIATSEMKLQHKVDEIAGSTTQKTIVITGDTIISIDDKEILEKPRDKLHAK
jgi:predicted house-cleaning NTP pyrophosphatase (Maf/HAM1 superfamily)